METLGFTIKAHMRNATVVGPPSAGAFKVSLTHWRLKLPETAPDYQTVFRSERVDRPLSASFMSAVTSQLHWNMTQKETE